MRRAGERYGVVLRFGVFDVVVGRAGLGVCFGVHFRSSSGGGERADITKKS